MRADLAYALTAEVMATADTFLRESQRLFRPHGLSGAQYNVLQILAGSPDGLSQRQLGDKLVVDRSNVTGLLDRMSKAGWVRRADHPEDRRVYNVSLTPEGRRLWEKLKPLYEKVVEQVTERLSGAQMKQAIATLSALQQGAKRWKLPGHETNEP